MTIINLWDHDAPEPFLNCRFQYTDLTTICEMLWTLMVISSAIYGLMPAYSVAVHFSYRPGKTYQKINCGWPK